MVTLAGLLKLISNIKKSHGNLNAISIFADIEAVGDDFANQDKETKIDWWLGKMFLASSL